VRAGQPLEFSGAALAPGARVELLDATGRRVAETRVDAFGRAALARERTRALVPGLYFARVPGAAAVGRVVVIR
jgi:hypothetical protein